jgi:hypothetical protein
MCPKRTALRMLVMLVTAFASASTSLGRRSVWDSRHHTSPAYACMGLTQTSSWLARQVYYLRIARLHGGASDSDSEDGEIVHGGHGPVHNCHDHMAPPCRESDKMLWISAAMGDVTGIRRALQQGAEVNYRNEHDSKRAALHYVVSNRNLSCTYCHRTAASGSDPSCPCRLLIISELITAGANVSLPCALGTHAIHLAAATGAVAAAKALVRGGVDVRAKDRSRRQPLHYAAVI